MMIFFYSKYSMNVLCMLGKASLCTHMREKLNDILGVGELIGCFLLQEGKPAIKRSTVLTSGPK